MHVSSEGHTAQSCGRSLLYDQFISSQILTSFSFQITIKKKRQDASETEVQVLGGAETSWK